MKIIALLGIIANFKCERKNSERAEAGYPTFISYDPDKAKLDA